MVANRSFCLISHTAGQRRVCTSLITHTCTRTTHTHKSYMQTVALSRTLLDTHRPRLRTSFLSYLDFTGQSRLQPVQYQPVYLSVCVFTALSGYPLLPRSVLLVKASTSVKPCATEGLYTFNLKAKTQLTCYNPAETVIFFNLFSNDN